MKSLLFPFFAAMAAFVPIAACSEERPPGEGGGSSSGGAYFEGGARESGVRDAQTSERQNPERLCEALPQEGSEIEELAERGNLPEPTGGMIEPGTYILARLVEHRGSVESDGDVPPPLGTTGRAGRATIRVAGSALRFVEAFGQTGSLPTDTTRGVGFTSRGTALELIDECPTSGGTQTLPYSVAGTRITFLIDGSHSQIYQKLP